MTTFTKEQLIARINQVTAINKYRINRDPDADGLAMDNELFAIALASLEAECQHQWSFGAANKLQRQRQCVKCGRVELVSPPAPVEPDSGRKQFEEWFKFHHGEEGSIVVLHRANGGANYRDEFVDLAWIAWKDSRAAMQGKAEPVSQRDELPSREHFISLCNQFWNWQESDEINAGDEEPRLEWNGSEFTHRVTQALWRMYQASPGNSPVIPDGWVACSERMPEIYTWVHVYTPEAYVAEQILPDRLVEVGDPENGPFWDYHGREGVTHWMPLLAAPQQEVKP